MIMNKSIMKELGVVSNLITDMTLKGATKDELERATEYSKFLIDAHKNGLDYKQKKEELGIPALKAKYLSALN